MSNYILGRSIHEQTDRIFNLASESIADLKNAMSQRLCYRSLGSSAAESSLCIISRVGGTVGVHQIFGPSAVEGSLCIISRGGGTVGVHQIFGPSAAEGSLCIISRAGDTVGVRQIFGQK